MDAILWLISCKEDIPDADRVQGLLQDLENIRADRLRMGMLSVARASFLGERVHSVKVFMQDICACIICIAETIWYIL